MGTGAISAATGGFILLLALAVWLAFRLKKKNKQLKKALAELERRAKESQAEPKLERAARPEPVAKPEPAPVIVPPKPAAVPAAESEPATIADAFLWEHLSDRFLWKHLSAEKPAPKELTPSHSSSTPAGLCDRAALQTLLEADLPFTGLVVLVGIAKSRASRQDHPAEHFVVELLRPADFACRNSDDEFLIVCPGLRGAEAQRHLNEISERLWNFQLRGQGSFSVLFSWGGIGAQDQSLSDAIASATERMHQTKRSRVLLFKRKAG